MNYDLTDLPAGYDRARDHGPELLQLWMGALARHVGDFRIWKVLDLGCGTGRFTEALAEQFDADVTGIDPSLKMLDLARTKQRDARVQYGRGSAEAIPLPAAAVDAIFMSMSFHHFEDRRAAAMECRRILRDNGFIFVRTGIRERAPEYAYVPFFPSTPALIASALPSLDEVRGAFASAGFDCIASELIVQTIAPNFGVYADKLEAGGDSVLVQLTGNELKHGLSALRRYAEEHPEQAVSEPIDLLVFR